MQTKKPDASELAKNTDYNAKSNEIEIKIPSTSRLATTVTLTQVKIKYLMLVI